MRLKHGWFHLKLCSMFQDLSRRSIETGFMADLRRSSNSLNSDSLYITGIGLRSVLIGLKCLEFKRF